MTRDACPLDNPDDSDGDSVCDSADICPGDDASDNIGPRRRRRSRHGCDHLPG